MADRAARMLPQELHDGLHLPHPGGLQLVPRQRLARAVNHHLLQDAQHLPVSLGFLLDGLESPNDLLQKFVASGRLVPFAHCTYLRAITVPKGEMPRPAALRPRTYNLLTDVQQTDIRRAAKAPKKRVPPPETRGGTHFILMSVQRTFQHQRYFSTLRRRHSDMRALRFV